MSRVRQPAGVQGEDLVVKALKAALVLAHDLRFGYALAVARGLDGSVSSTLIARSTSRRVRSGNKPPDRRSPPRFARRQAARTEAATATVLSAGAGFGVARRLVGAGARAERWRPRGSLVAVGVARRRPAGIMSMILASGWHSYATCDSSFQTGACRPAYRIRSPVRVRWLLPVPSSTQAVWPARAHHSGTGRHARGTARSSPSPQVPSPAPAQLRRCRPRRTHRGNRIRAARPADARPMPPGARDEHAAGRPCRALARTRTQDIWGDPSARRRRPGRRTPWRRGWDSHRRVIDTTALLFLCGANPMNVALAA